MAIDSLSAAGSVLANAANAVPASSPQPARGADTAAVSLKPQAPASPPAQSVEASLAQIKQAASAVQAAVAAQTSNLAFGFAKDAGTTVLQLTDKQSGDVILQIPSKAVIAVADQIDKPGGLFIQQKA